MSGWMEINDLRVWIRNNPIIQGITEFNTAVRQGSPSNDDRNLASFLSFEDFRGGIGQITGDIREDSDKIADSDGAVILKFQEMIKPPLMSDVTLSGATKTLADTSKMLESDIDGTMRAFFNFAHQVWYSNGSAMTMAASATQPYSSGTDITDVIVYEEPVDGSKWYIVGGVNANIRLTTDPVNSGGSITWANTSGTEKAQTFIVFDGKLWAGGQGTLKSAIVADGTYTTLAGNWPRSWRFIGVFPFGDTYAPYAIINYGDNARAQIAVIDVDNGKVIPLNLGVTGIKQAVAFGSEILIIANAGRDVFTFDPFARSKQELDWRAQERNGFIPARDGTAVSAFEHPRGPFIISNLDDTTTTQHFLHKSTGWMPYGRVAAGDAIPGGMYVQHLNTLVLPYKPSGSNIILSHIPWLDEAWQPDTNQDELVETVDISAITPWFDMGFSQLAGALLAMHCGGWFDASSQVKVEYQLDNITADGWTTLGTFPNVNAPTESEITGRPSPVEATDRLVFTSLQGIAFTRARFRITLITDASVEARQTPNALPLTLQFVKRPDIRDSIRIEVGVEETIAGPGDIESVDQLMTGLRNEYNQDQIPVMKYAGRTTYAFLTSLPTILELRGGRPPTGDVTTEESPTGATIVTTMAEPI